MNKVTMVMPRLGETMEHGVVAAWLVKPGESFKRGDPIIEFETDKTAVEYPALGSGVLVTHLVDEGDQVSVGEPIAMVDIGEGDNWLDTGGDDDQPPAESTGESEIDSVDAELSEDSVSSVSGNVRATPVARRAARQNDMDLNTISGTGRRGRIELDDVEKAQRLSIDKAGAGAGLLGDTTSEMGPLSFVGDIAYRSFGPDEGDTYLLLHGFAADHSAWALLSSALAKAGCRAVAIDLPGHGASRSQAYDVASLIAGLDDVLTDVIGHAGCHVVAHSMGAVAAVELMKARLSANRQSIIHSLTLIAPAGIGLSIDGQFIRGMAEPASRAEVAHLLRRLGERPPTLSPDAIDGLYDTLRQGRLTALAACLAGEEHQQIDILEDLASIASRLRVSLIVGHGDRILDWRDTLRVSPRVAVHHLTTAGHMPHWDEPRTVAEIILAAG